MLKHGLKFTPTPETNEQELHVDIQEFGRKLRLKEFFADRTPENDESLVRNKSPFTPPKGRDVHLDKYINTISDLAETTNSRRHNISRVEKNAMKELKTDETIVVKQADKGGAIVIMDSDYYRGKVLEQLNDPHYYSEIPSNIDNATMKKIKKIASQHGLLTQREQEYITSFEVKCSNFYGLPKIHKSKQIQEAVKLQNSECVKIFQPADLKLRPIVAGPSCPTHRLSNLLDIILKPLCQHIPSYLRDDLDFIAQLPLEIDEETLLVSFDVTSLYTNIPHELGIEAIRFWVNKHPEAVHPRFNEAFIIESLKIILQNNTFYFDGKYYKQILGTAMGTKVAPTYANLVMGYLEHKLYEIVKANFGDTFSMYIKGCWKRYLDDCFIIWTKSRTDLSTFEEILNNLNPSIKFTMENSETELAFLDVLVQKSGKNIVTDIYYKSTDTHQYLDFRSCHPSHTKRNIPFCLARRICAIVIDIEKREERLNELQVFLHKQHYPKQLITKGIERAKTIPLEELRKPKVIQESKTDIPFVLTHNPGHRNMVEVAKNSIAILHKSTKMRDLIKPSDILQSKRQPRNLKKILTRAKFDTSDKRNQVVSKCGDTRCGTCKHIKEGHSLTLKNGKVIKPNSDLNCKSRNLIYCITCPTCLENYIGQTGNALSERVRVHRQQIRSPETRNIPLSEHLDNCGKGHFWIFPFYKMSELTTSKRISKEDFFVKMFNPSLNAH